MAAPEVPRVDSVGQGLEPPGGFEGFLLREYRGVVELAYACRATGPGPRTSPKAFLRAHRDWPRVGGYQYPGAWVRRVAVNLATSAVRRRLIEARALARLWARQEPALAELPASGTDFWRAVRSLPRRQAQAVALHYLKDLPVAEIARVLGCAEGTVKAHLHHGREALGRRLALFEERGLYDLCRVERRRGRAQVVAAFALLLAMVTAGVLATRYDPPAAGPLPSLGTIPVGRQPSAMAVGHGALWVANQGDGTLSRVDLATDRVVATVPVGDAADVVAAGPDAVWVGGWSRRAGNTVSRVDPLTNRVVATVPLASEPYGLAVTGDAVWATELVAGTVTRIDPSANRVVATIRTGGRPVHVAAAKRSVWVAYPLDTLVRRIDPLTNTVAGTVRVAQPQGWPSASARSGCPASAPVRCCGSTRGPTSPRPGRPAGSRWPGSRRSSPSGGPRSGSAATTAPSSGSTRPPGR